MCTMASGVGVGVGMDIVLDVVHAQFPNDELSLCNCTCWM
jgi:hypothetical protein